LVGGPSKPIQQKGKKGQKEQSWGQKLMGCVSESSLLKNKKSLKKTKDRTRPEKADAGKQRWLGFELGGRECGRGGEEAKGHRRGMKKLGKEERRAKRAAPSQSGHGKKNTNGETRSEEKRKRPGGLKKHGGVGERAAIGISRKSPQKPGD